MFTGFLSGTVVILLTDLTALLYRIRTYTQEADWQDGKKLSKKRAERIKGDLHRYLNDFRDYFQWDEASDRLSALCNLISLRSDSWSRKLPANEFTVLVHKELEELEYAITAELDSRRFVMIDKKFFKYFDEDDLFGKTVSDAFPSAKSDIKCSGSCLAADLNTAAVFHLMRVMEYGLRALAHDLKAKTVIKIIKGNPVKTKKNNRFWHLGGNNQNR